MVSLAESSGHKTSCSFSPGLIPIILCLAPGLTAFAISKTFIDTLVIKVKDAKKIHEKANANGMNLRDISNGSVGMGLSLGIGVAISAKKKNGPLKTLRRQRKNNVQPIKI